MIIKIILYIIHFANKCLKEWVVISETFCCLKNINKPSFSLQWTPTNLVKFPILNNHLLRIMGIAENLFRAGAKLIFEPEKSIPKSETQEVPRSIKNALQWTIFGCTVLQLYYKSNQILFVPIYNHA